MNKLGYWVAGIAAGTMVVVVGHYLYAFATGTRFTVDQWSAAGGWVGGLGAFAAVAVALWQIKRARDDAEESKTEADERLTRELEAADQRLVKELERVHAVSAEQMAAAEARHTAQLMKSDELLANELDAQRRAEQIRCIPPIWQQIADLAFPFQDFQYLLTDLPSMPRTNEAAEEFMAKAEPWMRSLMDLEMGFSTAHFIVSEPHTQAALKTLYLDTRKLHELSATAAATAVQRHAVPDMTELKECYKTIINQRKTMTEIVREHLAQVPPLRQAEDTEDIAS
ncbi:hypothetical protein QM806_04515 [Rhodococcus sp. IEGM 1351]|uniref:hypothetical protein n=1 Tax=Rhodococcus sp. IEGM 1351 TaxID=3047089 RepID=UPI0024B7AEFF|nr:hypothetical protein [Rhodococcus sp. IEGM 1351]MDI9934718.1 hypothetical protein [Rhodococcus sp. IEGM 1351]